MGFGGFDPVPTVFDRFPTSFAAADMMCRNQPTGKETSMRVLVVEDNVNLADVVGMGLRMKGFDTTVIYDGRDAIDELDGSRWDLLILDRDLPGVHGDEICRRLRARRDPVHILMLTAASRTDDIVQGLGLGADDYLTKPFAYAELLARVEAVRRRLGLADTGPFVRDGFRADFRTGDISMNGEPLRFGQRELAVLRMLVEAHGAVVGVDRLYDEVWQDDHAHAKSIVKSTVYTLRSKIGPDLIETIPGQGYRIS
ncbi:response regulator transcription factor [Bifidobacterium olomucense]|uniref:Transcriptional regulator n=1 Tax=Bifidobacterium olomucense TaxID=2675324 RepID=A0A7Y0EZD7_9BIFI|nr:response regulator transcription factor [Bifidobacterium sp. DSM 109959]NMM99204.1 transcriptional regulator [Bifidobacterium sp. DSM 109959]